MVALVPRSRGILLVLLLLIVPLLLAAGPATAQSGSLGVTPAELRVEQAQEGERYGRQVTIQNVLDTPTVFTLKLRGDLEAWTTTAPADRLEVPAQTNAKLQVKFDVPSDAYIGSHTGFLTIEADPGDQPEGSGLATSWAVTVLLNVTVGGDPFQEVIWSQATAQDVEAGTPPIGSVNVANTGNVVTLAQARAQILDFHDDEVLAETQAQSSVIPGRTQTLQFEFDDPLPEGQYRMRFRSIAPTASYEATDTFKVVPPGALGKAGILRFIEHEPWVAAGEPVRLAAVFDNTGNVTIARAGFTAEVYRGDRLVGVVESPSLVVLPGETQELAAFYEPQERGKHIIVGRVNYDGFETEPSESILNVQSSGPASLGAMLPWLLLAAVVVAGTGWALWRRRQASRQEG